LAPILRVTDSTSFLDHKGLITRFALLALFRFFQKAASQIWPSKGYLTRANPLMIQYDNLQIQSSARGHELTIPSGGKKPAIFATTLDTRYWSPYRQRPAGQTTGAGEVDSGIVDCKESLSFPTMYRGQR